MCELVLRETQTTLREVAPSLVNRIMGYRAGYTPEDRRRIEGRLFRGDLLCVVATNALELGVDIGSLGNVLGSGIGHFTELVTELRNFRRCCCPFEFPVQFGVIQAAGGKGRTKGTGFCFDSGKIVLSVFGTRYLLCLFTPPPKVADGDNPLDQYYMKTPDELLTMKLEGTGVELSNELVIESHLQCAAAELPIKVEDDTAWFGEMTGELCKKHLLWDENLGVSLGTRFPCSFFLS